MPPAPNVIAGPKTSSVATPTISSRPCAFATMRSTDTPSTRACGRLRATVSIISAKAARTAPASGSPRRTPPTSLLCVMSGERIFITTG
jgi:hypothetical protein